MFDARTNFSKEISEILEDAFDGHPFKVLDDENMDELVSSVKERGVLLPIIVHVRDIGGYEII